MPKKRSGSAFTVDVPRPLPAERDGEQWWMEVEGRRLRLSNLDKVFWPSEGYTKGDLLAYYWNVAETILPYVSGRPLTMKRMPDGAEGPFFYEKNAPSHTPDWMPRCPVADQETGKSIDYLMVEDAAGLLYVANLGCIEFHPLHSRCEDVERPSYLFFDLDPFQPITFEDVLIVARHVKAALDALGLPSYPKTSGATGMQIYVGLDPAPTYDEVRAFVGAVGRAIRGADPDRVTMEWDVSKRSGKVFIDHNMNRLGANIAAVYSVRPEAGATVSTPISWEEVEAGVHPADFTIANIHGRIAEVGDPFRPVLDDPVDPREPFSSIGISVGSGGGAGQDRGEGGGAPEARGVGTPAEDRTRRGNASGPREQRTVRGGPGDRDDGAVTAPTSRSGAGPGRSPHPAAEGGDEKLRRYGEMRDFEATPEPPPAVPERGGDRFVIHKHDATRLHYDLRLERDGVLVSWAVPRGLPLAPGDRRLAVHTEDHPIEYATFEGWIPEGNYGAGEVRIFDAGSYEAPEWKDDKVTFRLHGHRHRGEYHLVKTKTDWLVFLSKSSAEIQPEPPPMLAPMLAEGGHKPFDDEGWWFEPKLDGIRTLAYVTTDQTRLVSRTGRDQTATYPELANLARFVNALYAVIDGEIVAADENGRPSFERLQQRMNLAAPKDVERARRRVPVTLFAFDLLWLDGRDLTTEPLEERRELLEEIVTVIGPMGLSVVAPEDGRAFFDQAKRLGLEGIVAKRLGSPYQPGRRTKDWRKIKAVNQQDCLVLGWTPGTGSRGATFGALLVGAYRDGELVWVGQVGTGFTEPVLKDIIRRLSALEQAEPPVADPDLAAVKGARWVRPELVCEVEYLEMTSVGKLRAPSFKGLRPDKAPADCVLEPPAG